MTYLFSLALSFCLGFLLINLLSFKKPVDLLQTIILSAGIGLGLSGQIVFYSLLINDAYSPGLICGLHAGLIGALVPLNIWQSRRHPDRPRKKINWDRHTLVGLGALCLVLIPLWREAHFFPFGGWDAWSCWNLKARFIYLGGDNWKNMFDPALWRSNNQYPFLLPLITVWGWTFFKEPAVIVPIAHAIVFSLLTAALLYASLERLTKNRFAFVPALVLFTIPFVNTLSISQYSDIVVAFFLLAALSSLVQARLDNHPAWAILGGLSVGIMSFAKTEGLVLGVIVAAAAVYYFRKTRLLRSFAAAAFVAFLPTIIFKVAWAPANIAFTNGLTSTDAPSTFFRLQATAMFFLVELKSAKWNGLWVLLLFGSLIAGTKGFRQDRWIIPAALLAFLLCTAAYYYINTYFEITWWLKTTLNRVLYTILPALVWWVFLALWAPEKK